MKDNHNNKKVILTVMFVAILTIVVIGTSFAFFNYTRTGSANTLKVGRISFNHTQDGNITLTNIFPMSSEEFENSTQDPSNNVTINIEGDTTYPNGVEYLVTAEDVNIEVNNKRIPLTLKVTSTTDLGNNDEDYFTNRGGSTNIHKVLSGGVVVDGQYLVVGYIAPGQTGVEGSLNISAYINSDNIVISDTYDGTESNNMGTTNEWVGNKTVFTTSEWNSLSGSSNSLSFKIRVEANEGIWVDPYTTPNLMNTIGISRSANIKEIRFIEETPLRMQRRYDASIGQESDNTKLDLTYQDTGKVLAWIEPISVNPTGTSSNLNIKPSFLVNENQESNIKQIDNETSYILYIASSGKTKWVYTGTSNIFSGFTNVEKIVFENFDTSSVPIMTGMFKDLSKLTSVNMTALDTSSVYYMNEMFSGCSSLTNIDLSGLGSDSLVYVANMFGNCTNLQEIIMKKFNFGHVNFESGVSGYSNYYCAFSNLPNVETIDLTNANTSGVTNMFDMFYNCKKLRNIIGLNTLDTSSVTDMQYMFSECDALTSIDLSNLKIISVQTMHSMFSGCDYLQNVIFTGRESITLTDMSNMFASCPRLMSVNVSGLGGDNLNNMGAIFYNCTSLKNINMSNFNFGKISSFNNYESSGMFWSLMNVLESIDLSGANFSGPNITECHFKSFFDTFSKLKFVNLSNANTSKVVDMERMFYYNEKLENLDLTGIDTSNVTDMQYMFDGCKSISSLNLSNLNTSKVTTMYNTFRGMSNLEEINISGWGGNNLSEIAGMLSSNDKLKTIIMDEFNFGTVSISNSPFSNSSSIEKISLNNANMSSVRSVSKIFSGLQKLKSVYLENVDTSNITNMSYMFDGCTDLEKIYVSNTWNTSNVTSSDEMFSGCTSLVGGNGTVFDSTKIDKTMAVIDTPSTPGYLTVKTN